jgi:hypothetical protein
MIKNQSMLLLTQGFENQKYEHQIFKPSILSVSRSD